MKRMKRTKVYFKIRWHFSCIWKEEQKESSRQPGHLRSRTGAEREFSRFQELKKCHLMTIPLLSTSTSHHLMPTSHKPRARWTSRPQKAQTAGTLLCTWVALSAHHILLGAQSWGQTWTPLPEATENNRLPRGVLNLPTPLPLSSGSAWALHWTLWLSNSNQCFLLELKAMAWEKASEASQSRFGPISELPASRCCCCCSSWVTLISAQSLLLALYSWIMSAGTRGPYRLSGIKSGTPACKAGKHLAHCPLR